MSESKGAKMNEKTLRKGSWMRSLLKFGLWSVVAIVLLVCGLLQATISILTPERLTPLVEKFLTKSLNADVEVSRVELTVWETFPDVTLEIDSLSVRSRALDGLTDSIKQQLPANADSLASLKYFHGGIKLHELLVGNLSLYDIQLHEPMVNLVKVDSTMANYDVLPPSEPDTVPDTSTTELPKIIIDHFIIKNAKPISYFSLADSIDAKVLLKNVELKGTEAPQYEIEFKGDLKSPLLSLINQSKSPFIIDGGVEWNQDEPTLLALNDFDLGFDIVNTHINGKFDLGQNLAIKEFRILFDSFKYADVYARVPKEYLSMLKGISTNATIDIDAQLTKPFYLDKDSIPSAVVNVKVPNCKFKYDNLNLDRFSANISAILNGNNLDKTVIDVKKVALNGMGVGCSLSTKVTSIISDPSIDGEFNGKVDLAKLPPIVSKAIAGRVSGILNADTQFKLRQSYLDKNKFHNILVKGGAELQNFRFKTTDALTDVYVRNAELTLGTNESFIKSTRKNDSLLAVSVKLDTCALFYDGYDVKMSDFKAGVGCSNVATSTDASQINPIGGAMSIGRLNFKSQEDSMKVRLRDVKCMSALRRFKAMEKVPELMLNIDANRVGAVTKEMRVNLRESAITLIAHLKPRRKMSPQMKNEYDKIMKANPGLTNDSAYAMVRRQMMSQRKANARGGRRDSMASEISTIDFDVDRSIRALLNRWNAKGSIKSKRVRLFTPYFPLRNRLSNVDVSFTTDSIAFNKVDYKVGRSNFAVRGSISNIKKALSGRARQPLKMAFMLRSDTIDVNQIAEAVFAGAAYSESAVKTSVNLDEENEELLEAKLEQQAETKQSGALLVPMNIDALLRVSAKNIIYGDMLLHNMSGNVQVYRGALHFDQLRASADMGSVNLSALYSAPTKKNMSFGFGLQIKDLYIDKVLELVPAVDSIMPLLSDVKGIVNADIAATTDVDTMMNLKIPTLNAAIKIEGDSLVLLDAKTFRTVSKWLLFRNKKKNMIDKLSVEVLVKDSQLELFPFVFTMDRYKLGVLGYNDLALNFNYHVSVLESPIPFKFGINVKGNPDKLKVRLGRAKFKENMVAERVAIVDTTRVNLLRQIKDVFRRGIDRSSRLSLYDSGQKVERFTEESNDTISHADSLLFIQEGLLPAPPQPQVVTTTQESTTESKSKSKNKK